MKLTIRIFLKNEIDDKLNKYFDMLIYAKIRIMYISKDITKHCLIYFCFHLDMLMYIIHLVLITVQICNLLLVEILVLSLPRVFAWILLAVIDVSI